MVGAVRRYGMFIDGRRVDPVSGRVIVSIDPSTEEPWAEFPDASESDVDLAVRAAHRAFEEGPWRRMPPAERGKRIRRFAELIRPHAERLGRAETTDTGKLYRETRWQAANVAEIYDFYGGLADKIPGEVAPAGGDQPLALVLREPIGVVAAIVPWNSQLHLAAYKLAPALAAGCTVVLKPSEQAAAAVLELAEIIAEADFPPGVVNVVCGGPECGQALTSHPLVRRISFTGGVETARRIIPNSARNIARMSLELGGKSPMIVWEDADMDTAVNGLLAGIFGASGQSCAAGSRLLIHERIHDRVMDRLVARACSIRIGDPMAEDTEMGPLATRGQVDKITRLLEESVSKGARIVTGGSRPPGFSRGHFWSPTVVSCDHQDYPVVQNELFGPVLSVLRINSEEQAISLANGTRYAFAAGVFTTDIGRAVRLSRAIRAGRIWVNSYRTTSMYVPFGGFNESGYGRESGLEAVRDYTDTKGIFIDVSGKPPADPFVMR
jgi:acyl-CoA reductase-like NAD-dependent aldehyde dehydrogenase